MVLRTACRLFAVPLALGYLSSACGGDPYASAWSPNPRVTALLQASALQCDRGFTLTLAGSGFVRSSIVRWNDNDRNTTYLGPSGLEAAIRGRDLATPGTAQVTVFNPPPAGGISHSVPFTIQERPEGTLPVPVALDIIRYNEDADGSAAYRRLGEITRWELPVPVYVDSGVNREAVVAALEHWREHTGITYTMIDADVEPRLLVRTGTDGLGNRDGRGLVDGTYDNNRARSGLVVLDPRVADCQGDCRFLLRHELGHALGFFGHLDIASLMNGGRTDLVPREAAMMRALYTLPHGTAVEPTGCWDVVLP